MYPIGILSSISFLICPSTLIPELLPSNSFSHAARIQSCQEIWIGKVSTSLASTVLVYKPSLPPQTSHLSYHHPHPYTLASSEQLAPINHPHPSVFISLYCFPSSSTFIHHPSSLSKRPSCFVTVSISPVKMQYFAVGILVLVSFAQFFVSGMSALSSPIVL